MWIIKSFCFPYPFVPKRFVIRKTLGRLITISATQEGARDTPKAALSDFRRTTPTFNDAENSDFQNNPGFGMQGSLH